VSLPDDETREPGENLTPDEPGDETAEQQPVSRPDPDAEAPQDGAFEAGIPEADAGDAYAPAGEEEGLAKTPLDESDETVDFAAPAEMESGIAFQSMESADEVADEAEGAADEEPLPDFGDQPGDVGMEKAEDEGAEAGEEEEDEEAPESRARRVLAAIGQSDPYTVMMGIALLALLIGTLFFIRELSAYNFDVGAERGRQLVGALGFGWLLG